MGDVVASTVIGAISGIAEVTVNQPLIFVKNALQTVCPTHLHAFFELTR